ncbi:MAG: hypothetical protein COA66_00710 [Arcobacter sp.]|nr:MAG: hypothetical protein COA66_00710 [Arcobacter sp.]
MKILIVDDLSKNIQFVANILSTYNLSFAKSGEKALELIKKEKFDLILLDVIMGGISGYETCIELRKMNGYASVPVIFLSGNTDLDNINKGLKAGGQAYISKPFTSNELINKVNNILTVK